MTNTDPSRIPTEQQNKPVEFTIKHIWKRLTNQWGWKLTSLLLAICLWGGLISQDTTLPREKTFTDVRINVANTAVMKNNGFIVVEGLEDLQNIQIKVKVPQKYYNSVSAPNYNVRVDLSQIKEAGPQTLKLTSTSTSNVYGSVIEMSITDIPVVVERYETRTRIPVEVRTIGDAPEGYLAVISDYDPVRVDIAGPISVVRAVSRCVVEYDFNDLNMDSPSKTASCSYFFETVDGQPLDSSLLTVTTQSSNLQHINLTLGLYPKIDVPVETENLVSGVPAPGYEITGITVLPTSVAIAGDDISRYLNGEKIHPYSNIDISGKKQNVVSTLTLRVPSSMKYVSDTMITVIVTIEPTQAESSPDHAQ